MKIACCIWALTLPEIELLRQVRELGFSWIDIQPMHLQTSESQLLAQELGLQVSCVGGSFGMPAGATLDSADKSSRQQAIDHVKRAIETAAEHQAATVYVVPGLSDTPAALQHYAGSLSQLADVAEAKGIKLALEHFPGMALPTASQTLEFIHQTGHANLYLLLDIGHVQISGEDPATIIHNAGDRLAYVHLDDNDGIGDLHWSLLDGVMTEEALASSLRALEAIGYDGALSLELSPALPKPAKALQESRDLLMRVMQRL